MRPEADVFAFVRATYGKAANFVTMYESYANPALAQGQAGEVVSPYETVPGCHVGCTYEQLHDVAYSATRPWRSLVAETTCGTFVVWQD